MRLEHHLVGGYMYMRKIIIIIIIIIIIGVKLMMVSNTLWIICFCFSEVL